MKAKKSSQPTSTETCASERGFSMDVNLEMGFPLKVPLVGQLIAYLFYIVEGEVREFLFLGNPFGRQVPKPR